MEYGLSKLFGKRILIRVDGSHAIGLGHIYRMKTLGCALQKYGCDVVFLTMVDQAANDTLNTTGLPCYTFHADANSLVFNKVFEEFQPALVIQDILETSIESMNTLRDLSSANIINFDDIGAGLTMADTVVNSIVFHWNKYNSENVKARLFEGPQYMILQPEIYEYLHIDKRIFGNARNLLFVFGGTDTHNVTERALEAINDINRDLNIRINLGPGSKTTSRLERAVRESGHQIEVIQSTPSLLREFHLSDLVICGGGITLYELAALGVPSVTIATEPHEINNMNFWSEIGTTVSLGWEKTLDMNSLTEIVDNVLRDRVGRERMSRVGRQAMDNQGLTRVIAIIDGVLG